jgi:hypothetical protein
MALLVHTLEITVVQPEIVVMDLLVGVQAMRMVMAWLLVVVAQLVTVKVLEVGQDGADYP